MYVPGHFAMSDREVQHLLTHHGAGDLVTSTQQGLVATLLPFVYENGSLLGHLARNNDQWRHAALGESMVILRGPDAYVSPGWYATKADHGRVVPTWNYVTAHVYGELVVRDDVDFVRDVVERLTAKHEASQRVPWSVDDAPPAFVAGQLRAIVGVELRISRIEAKAKLSQNRSPADVDGVVRATAGTPMSEAVQAARPPR